MEFPPLQVREYDAIRAARLGNEGTLDSASLWRRILDRTWWIEINKRASCGWAQGINVSGIVSSTALQDFGTWPLASQGTYPSTVTVAMRVASLTTSGPTFYAQLHQLDLDGRYRPIGERVSVGTPVAAGWFSASMTLPRDVEGDTLRILGVRVTCEGGASASLVFGGCCVLADQQSSADGYTLPTTWPKLDTQALAAADRPDDVYSLHRMRSQQDVIVGRYPRTLAAHAYGAPILGGDSVTSTGGSARHREYRVRRGPRTTDVTAWIYALKSGTNNGTLTAYVDPTGSGGSTSIGTATVTSTTGAWHSIALNSGWTADALKDVRIEWVGIGPEPFSSVTVYAILLIEDEYDSGGFTSYLSTGDTMPTRLVGPYAMSIRQGDAIVSDYDGGAWATRNDDRETAARNTVFQGLYTSQVLVSDWITDALNSTTAAASSAATLLRWKWRAHKGADGLEVWFALRRSGVTTPQAMARIKITEGTGPTTELDMIVQPTEDQQPTWYRVVIGTPLIATLTYSLTVGWCDAAGNDLTVSDSLILAGARYRELPREDVP